MSQYMCVCVCVCVCECVCVCVCVCVCFTAVTTPRHKKKNCFFSAGTPAKLVEGSTGGAVLFAGKEGAAYLLRTTPPFKLMVNHVCVCGVGGGDGRLLPVCVCARVRVCVCVCGGERERERERECE